LHGLLFRSSPELASDDQNILEPVGQRLIWWARPHTGAGRRRNRSGAAKSITSVKLTQGAADLFARCCPSSRI